MNTLALVALLITLSFSLISWTFFRKVLIKEGVGTITRVILAGAYGLLCAFTLFPLLVALLEKYL